MNTLPKNAPHKFTHAQPWTSFKGKNVGRKEVSAQKIFRPGHKPNPALEGDTATSGAYGAFHDVPRMPAVEVARRNFGSYSVTTDDAASRAAAQARDALGPVDLAREANRQRGPSAIAKREEAPPDNLRWNPAADGGKAAVRRRQVNALLDDDAPHPLEAPSRTDQQQRTSEALVKAHRKDTEPVRDTLRDGPRVSMRGRAHDERSAMRAFIAEESKAVHTGSPAGGDAAGALANGGLSQAGGLSKEQRAQALRDPRVQAALDAALNGPNRIAAEQHKMRNTTQVSAERRW